MFLILKGSGDASGSFHRSIGIEMELGQYTDGKVVHFLQTPTLVGGFLQQSLDATYKFVEILGDQIVNSFGPQEWLCDLVQLVSQVDGAVSQFQIRQRLG